MTAVALLGLAGALLYALPAYVAARVHDELVARGIRDVEFRVADVRWDGVLLTDVRLEDELEAGEIDLAVDPLAARITAVTLRDARWSIGLDESSLRRSVIARLAATRPGAEMGPGPDRVSIERGHLELRRDGTVVTLDVDAAIDPNDERAEATLSSAWGRHAVRFERRGERFVLDARSAQGDARFEVAIDDPAAGGPIGWTARGAVARAVSLGDLTIGAGTRVDASGVVRRAGAGWTLDALSAEAKTPSLELAAADAAALAMHGVRVAIHGRGRMSGAGAVTLELDPSSVLAIRALAASELRVRGLELAPALHIEVPASGDAVAATAGVIALRAREVSGDELHVHDVRVSLAARAGAPLALAPARGPLRVAFALDAQAAQLDGPVRGREVRARGHVDAALGETPRLEAPVQVEIAALRERESGVSLTGLEFELDASLDRDGEPHATGHGRARGMRWSGAALGAVRGTFDLTRERLEFAARGRATASAPFDVDASIGLARHAGHVDVRVPSTEVGPGDAAHRVLLALTGLKVVGRASGEVHADLRRTGAGHARLAFEGASVDDVEHRGSAEALRGELRFTSLVPLIGASTDRLVWRSVTLGEMVTTRSGSARLTFERSGAIGLRDVNVAIGGGRVRVAPFEMRPDRSDEVTLDLAIEGVDLSRVCDVLSQGRVRASGQLDGRLGVQVRLGGAEPRVVLGEGSLSARGPGRLHIRELPSSTIEAMGFDQLRDGEWIERRVLAALADFRYQRLELDVRGHEREGTLRARLTGEGVRTPQEIGLTLAVRGIQPVLDHTLRVLGRRRAAIAAPTRPPARTPTQRRQAQQQESEEHSS